jgi:CheY-like chemotaxis protein
MPPWHIQIVDDDPSAALITQRGLQALLNGAVHVSIASSPNEAWMTCARGGVDLLIVDPSPRSNLSLGLVRAVRNYRPDIPILVLTAYDTPGLRARMRGLGVEHYVAKPVDLRELAPLVGRALHLPPRAAGPDFARSVA